MHELFGGLHQLALAAPGLGVEQEFPVAGGDADVFPVDMILDGLFVGCQLIVDAVAPSPVGPFHQFCHGGDKTQGGNPFRGELRGLAAGPLDGDLVIAEILVIEHLGDAVIRHAGVQLDNLLDVLGRELAVLVTQVLAQFPVEL